MGCHTIFQGVFQTQGSNPHFLPLPAPALQEDSLPLSHCCPLIAPQSHFPTVLFSLLLLSTLLAHIFFFPAKIQLPDCFHKHSYCPPSMFCQEKLCSQVVKTPFSSLPKWNRSGSFPFMPCQAALPPKGSCISPLGRGSRLAACAACWSQLSPSGRTSSCWCCCCCPSCCCLLLLLLPRP